MSKFEIFNNINNKSPPFPISMSSTAKALITGLLTKDPHKRLGWKEVAVDPWLEKVNYYYYYYYYYCYYCSKKMANTLPPPPCIYTYIYHRDVYI
jgi:serine/threonine protein kinase